MTRAGRIIYNLAVAVSLLLCLATVGVWVRSGWVSDTLVWSDWPVDRSYFDLKSVWSSRGGLQWSSWHCVGSSYMWWDDAHFNYSREPATNYPVYEDHFDLPRTSNLPHHRLLGFELNPETKGPLPFGSHSAFVVRSLTLPLYFPTLLFALLPAHYFLRVRRRRRIAGRRARGCCVECGYDLQATPNRCPECGTIPANGAL